MKDKLLQVVKLNCVHMHETMITGNLPCCVLIIHIYLTYYNINKYNRDWKFGFYCMSYFLRPSIKSLLVVNTPDLAVGQRC